MNDLAIGRVHRLEGLLLAPIDHFGGNLAREALERLSAPHAVSADVDPHPALVRAGGPPLDHGPGELLHGLERLALRADQETQIGARDLHFDRVVVDALVAGGGLDGKRLRQASQELGDDRRLLLHGHVS